MISPTNNSTSTNCLLIVDPQIDFCDIDPSKIGGYVPRLQIANAYESILKVADYIDANLLTIDGIMVSLDSHHVVDIAHTEFWSDKEGTTPLPFTQVTAKQIEAKEFYPKRMEWFEKALDYVQQLEANNKYKHTLWPPHAIMGTIGHALIPELVASLAKWEVTNQKNVSYIYKGQHSFTEHFSIIAAEVGDPQIPETMPNKELLSNISANQLLIATGLASSHCLKATLEDVNRFLPNTNQKRVLLKDTTAPVAGFEALEIQFFEHLIQNKWYISKSTEFPLSA